MTQRILVSFLATLFVGSMACAALSAAAQEAPAPRKEPRIPVNRQALPSRAESILQSRDVTGPATVVDGQHLRINNIDMYLFGVTPPQLSANFGPQARAALDALTVGNNVHCQIRDRDRDSHYLATCRTSANMDPAFELLKRGLAVTARSSLSGTELATNYLAAEQGAQIQKIGLWSVTTPAAATPVAVIPQATPAPTIVPAAPVTVAEPAKVDAPVVKAEAAPQPVAASILKADAKKDKPVTDNAKSWDDTATKDANKTDNLNFFARYQLLLTGVVMLLTALSISGVLFIQRRMERREEMKAIAAALRGELMAARALCQGRLKMIMTEADDRNMVWPRIRSTLYQAYVGRIGWLGAELARQIASLYGQSNDYAAYYQAGEDPRVPIMPKHHALQTMARHIEEILPKLAQIEKTGDRLPSRPMNLLPARPMHQSVALDSTPLPVASISAPVRVSTVTTTSYAPVPAAPPVAPSPASFSGEQLHKVETQIVTPAKTAPAVAPVAAVKVEAAPTAKAPAEPVAVKESVKQPVREAVHGTGREPAQEVVANLTKERSAPPTNNATAVPASASPTAAPAVVPASAQVASSAGPSATSTGASSGVPLWDVVRKFARDHLSEKPVTMDEGLPDYASLIEEDMMNFSFSESDYDFDDDLPNEPFSKSGGKG